MQITRRELKYRRRRLISGGGFSDVIMKVGKDGISLLKQGAIHGVRHLIPIVRTKGEQLAQKGIRAVADAIQNRAEKAVDKVAGAKKKGSGVNKHMIMREMRQAFGNGGRK